MTLLEWINVHMAYHTFYYRKWYLYIYLSLYLSIIYLYIYLSLYISNYLSIYNIHIYQTIYLQCGSKKSLWCDLEEKCLRNSKIFFDGVFPSVYSHLVKKLELSKLCRKKGYGALKILKITCSKKVILSKKRDILLFFFVFI